MPPFKARNSGLRRKIYDRLNKYRHRSQDRQRGASLESTPEYHEDRISIAADIQKETENNDKAHIHSDQVTLRTGTNAESIDQNSFASQTDLRPETDIAGGFSDLWSAAYREAVSSLGQDIDLAILKGENVSQLFTQLEQIDKEATQESAFRRGVKYLQSLQVPLNNFKLALDLASPLTQIEPTAGTVFGVVRSVTAIAISFSTADIHFAKQIGEMLEQISWIDACDTLGQKSDKKDIHKALVSVYQKLLEFYSVAFEILTRRGAKLMMKMIIENERLPSIVNEFLRHADNLRKLVESAIWEITEDIKNMLYDHEIYRWLGDEKITQQGKAHVSLRESRADQACEFLLTDPMFTYWYEAFDSQQLAILGEMGSGKSVAMSFLVDAINRRNKSQLPRLELCYHYCRDNETGEVIYVFSALILSLLEQFPGLKKTFVECYREAKISGNLEPALDIKKLEGFLKNILSTLDRSFFIIIDGLDECSSSSRNSLLKSLQNLLQNTSRLKILLSSRPQAEILEQLKETPKIFMACDRERDNLITEKKVDEQLSHLSESVRRLVTENLSDLACGSAIWIDMKIKYIKIKRITALEPMRSFLKESTPLETLSDLYANLISQYTSNDPENRKLATTALKLLAIAKRPLSILELAWAVALGSTRKNITTVAALVKVVDHQRIMDLIAPFIARVNFDDVKTRQVRLYHQSVKEFIIEHLASQTSGVQFSIASSATDQDVAAQRVECLEALALDICVKYLLLQDFNQLDLFSFEQKAVEALPQDCDLFNSDRELAEYNPYCTWEVWEEEFIRYDPTERGFGELFVYSSCYWLDHYGAITNTNLLHLENIGNLCQASSTRLQNWTAQLYRPGCTIKSRFTFESSLHDPLSITSLYGSEPTLQLMISDLDLDKSKFLPDSVVGAVDQILQSGDLARVKILFHSKVGHRLRNLAFFQLIIKRWILYHDRGQKWDVVFDLVDNVTDTLVQERWGNDLLCAASSAGCMPIVLRLMDKARCDKDLQAELMSASKDLTVAASNLSLPVAQSIGLGVIENHLEIVEYLLEQECIETHLRYCNSRGENILHLASKHCNPAIYKILVPHFKDGIDQVDDQQNSVLMRIITSPFPINRYESALIILSESVTLKSRGYDDRYREALQVSVRQGDLDMCRLLVLVGKADPLSVLTRGENGQMILKDQVFEDRNASEILESLCAYANQSPLSTARLSKMSTF